MKLKFIFLVSLLQLIFTSAVQAGVLGSNFHEIDPGRYYRSAQLSEKKLDHYMQKHGIKTVINLRGARPGADWYDEEVQVVEKNQGVLIDIGMSARRLPHRKDLMTLLEAFEKAERPILVHCQAGADRTGEASAIYQMLYMGKTKKQALKMLRLKYHHVEMFKPAKKYFIKKVWTDVDDMIENYHPCRANWKYYEKEEHCSEQKNKADHSALLEEMDN